MSRRTDVIKQTIEDREIPYLLHFTKAKNIPTIVQNGIVSREKIVSHPDPAMKNAVGSDIDRRDYSDHATSVSMVSYWHEMFRGKKNRNPGEDWVFLALDPHILWTLECHFYASGAGNSHAAYHTGRAGSTTAFQEIFEDRDPYGRVKSGFYRQSKKLPKCFPTEPVCEIHVLTPIPPEGIIGAFFLSEDCQRRLASEFEKISAPVWIKLAKMGSAGAAMNCSWGYLEPNLEPGRLTAEEEMRAIYEEFSPDLGMPAYLFDGYTIDPPED